MSPDALSIAARALAFMLLFQAVGAAFFIYLFAPLLRASWHPIRLLGIASAACAVLLALLHHGLEAARMAGEFSGLWDMSLQTLAWGSRSVLATALLVAGLLQLMWSMQRRSASPAHELSAHNAPLLACIGGAIALCAFLSTGHTSEHEARTLLASLLMLHLLIVAFWYGALWPLILVTRVESAPIAAHIVSRYSSIAGYLVPVIAVAGVMMGRILTGEWPGAWTAAQPYGQLLLLKLLLFALLMVPAAANKWWLVPALRTAAATVPASPTGAASALRRSIVLEMLLIAIVLTVTATLTTLYSPRQHEITRATASTMTALA